MDEKKITAIGIDKYKSLREMIFQSVRDAILRQELKPGQRLMELQLARDMGVSRTPVREALHKLILEGFAVVIPRRGVHVARISPDDIHEHYEIRGQMEALACKLAAEKATGDQIAEMEKCLAREAESLMNDDIITTINADIALHDLIYKASHNDRLRSMLNSLQEHSYRWRVTATSVPGVKKNSLEEHRGIVESIKRHDHELVEKLVRSHIEHTEQRLIEHLTGKRAN